MNSAVVTAFSAKLCNVNDSQGVLKSSPALSEMEKYYFETFEIELTNTIIE